MPSSGTVSAVKISPTGLVVLLDDQMHVVLRKSREERVGILIRKNLYLIAVSLLENEGGSRLEKVRVGEEYGKYLSRMGETKKAVEVFKGLGEGAKGVRCLMDEGEPGRNYWSKARRRLQVVAAVSTESERT